MEHSFRKISFRKKRGKVGGYGSGRTSKVGRRLRKKNRVEWLSCLNSFKCMPGKLAKSGGVTKVSIGVYTIIVTKRHLIIHTVQTKQLFKTPMRTIDSGFGLRYLFTCPHCRKRTSRLYCTLKIGCRGCLNLSYRSQNISNEDGWFLKREKLLKRYKVTFDDASKSKRPKGMHKKTFDRFMIEYNFINDMGINIHLDRFEYKKVFLLLRKGKRSGHFDYQFCDAITERFTFSD